MLQAESKNIALEGIFKDWAAEKIQRVKNVLHEVVTQGDHSSERLQGTVRRLKQQLGARTRLKEDATDIELDSGVSSLSVESRAVVNAEELHKVLQIYKGILEAINGPYTSAVMQISSALVSRVMRSATGDIQKAREQLDLLYGNFRVPSLEKYLTGGAEGSARVSPVYPGNWGITFQSHEKFPTFSTFKARTRGAEKVVLKPYGPQQCQAFLEIIGEILALDAAISGRINNSEAINAFVGSMDRVDAHYSNVDRMRSLQASGQKQILEGILSDGFAVKNLVAFPEEPLRHIRHTASAALKIVEQSLARMYLAEVDDGEAAPVIQK